MHWFVSNAPRCPVVESWTRQRAEDISISSFAFVLQNSATIPLVRELSIVAVLLLSGAAMAQLAPSSCPSNRPVDDYIAEINAAKSKKKSRTTNPLPDSICVFGWCTGTAKRPPKPNEPQVPAGKPAAGVNQQSASTSPAAIKCDLEMQQVLDAAHDVDVGDTYFQDKNYRAAMFRFQDAAKAKPDDAAIEVRLGRAYEKLKQPVQALLQYEAAAKLSGPEKWVDEARSSASRLQASK